MYVRTVNPHLGIFTFSPLHYELKGLSHGSPHTRRKIDNDIHNVLCQQLARRQDHAGLYVVYTYIHRAVKAYTRVQAGNKM